MPFWQTAVGGTAVIDGVTVQGAQNIFFAELASKCTTEFSVDATRFMAGKFPLMIFGLPGAALAMYRTARPEKRKVVAGLLLSAALTSMLTGITEPLEFTFLFVAPVMYAVHCVYAGLAYMLMHILNVGVGMTFSGGLIDLTLFGILQGNEKTHWIWVVMVGVFYFVLYYFTFYFMITKMNLKTPGREDDNEETKLYTRADFKEKTGVGPDAAGGSQGQRRGLGADPAGPGRQGQRLRRGLLRHPSARDGGGPGQGQRRAAAPERRFRRGSQGQRHPGHLRTAGGGDQVQSGGLYGDARPRMRRVMDCPRRPPRPDKPTAPAKSMPRDPGRSSGRHRGPHGGCARTKPLPPACWGTVWPLSPPRASCTRRPTRWWTTCSTPITPSALSPTTGVELLLHIGIDTVKLGGQHFTAHVKTGQKVKKGDLLICFDMDAIKAAGYLCTTPMIVCNTDDYVAVKTLAAGDRAPGQDLLQVE